MPKRALCAGTARNKCLKQVLICIYEFRFENIVCISQICVYEDSSYLLEKY